MGKKINHSTESWGKLECTKDRIYGSGGNSGVGNYKYCCRVEDKVLSAHAVVNLMLLFRQDCTSHSYDC